jgi:hypothetical protein
MSLAMTEQERERFLADLHVGVISIAEEGRGPLDVPVADAKPEITVSKGSAMVLDAVVRPSPLGAALLARFVVRAEGRH